MTITAIVITIITSLISGMVGVAASCYFLYKLERRKLKYDLAKRLLGYRFSIKGDEFSCAMNQVVAIFSDSPEVLQAMKNLYDALESPGEKNSEEALVDFLKAVCKESGLAQILLNDSYYLKTFNARD